MNFESLKNVHHFQAAAHKILNKESIAYLEGGADDNYTLKRNVSIFQKLQIRPRRLVDVSRIDMSIRMFGKTYETPFILGPVGLQRLFHREAELATAKAADKNRTLMISSTTSNESIGAISNAFGGETKPWFQLYPTSDLTFREKLVKDAEAAGCKALVLTVDMPVLGNRESHVDQLKYSLHHQNSRMGNLASIPEGESFLDPSLTWRVISWLKVRTSMKILLKGIMTAEDARLAVENGIDGIIVSNHGGRQLECNMSPLECLEAVVEIVKGRIPVIMDGGIRRGTDVFKALALGAKAVCLGRAYIYGLSVGGEAGVSRVLEILEKELFMAMQLAGVPAIKDMNENTVKWI